MRSSSWGASEIATAVREGDLSAESVIERSRQRIQAVEPELHALLAQDFERALRRARELDGLETAKRSNLSLMGVPLVVKDNIITEQLPTTAGSRILEEFRPPYQATVVARALARGAIVIAKSNMDEFGMGSSTEYSAFGPTRNPWNADRVPGGSSGGSAAAVASGMAPLALGSDTGGSIRQPAAFCGVVGLKPTYGRVSRFGLIAYASSLDQVGPLARTVEDAAILLEAISGSDELDATSADQVVPDYLADLDRPLTGLRVGVPSQYFGVGIEPAVRDMIQAVLVQLEGEGATLVPLDLTHTDYAIAAYYLIAMAEASSNLSRYDGVRYGMRADSRDLGSMYTTTRATGFGPEVRRRILLGTHALSSGYYDQYYLKAQKVRTLIRRDFEQAFAHVDVIATPTAPEVAFALNSRSDDPMKMYLSDICTVTANLAGLPALSVPVGFSAGLPIGLQLIGPAFSEPELLRAGRMVERMVQLPAWPGEELSE